MFNIIQVPDAAGDLAEQLGTKRKFWFQGEGGELLLFKAGRPGTGEDWAEKIASCLCEQLRLPHAVYELARWREFQGVVTASFVPRGSRLVLGNELLARVVRGYDPTVAFYKQSGHTVSRVTALMGSGLIDIPHGWQPNAGINRAIDVFVGYLMLDAWIGNTDRHDENWGVIVATGPPVSIQLAPTFDHASSLGRNESDEKRRKRLESRDPKSTVGTYADRARSAFFRTPGAERPMLTIDAFLSVARRNREAGSAWIQCLRNVAEHGVRDLLAKVPPEYISNEAREFAAELLVHNGRRLVSNFDQVTE